jgi:hypothetical protein
MSSFATTFKLHTERHQRAVHLQFASFCLKYGFPTLKPTMPCNFWIDIINLSQEFSEKNLHAISYSFQRSDSVHEFELNDERNWHYYARILEFMKCKPNLP